MSEWTIVCGYDGCTEPAIAQLSALNPPTAARGGRATVTCARHEAVLTRWCGGEGGPVTRTPIAQAAVLQPILFEQG